MSELDGVAVIVPTYFAHNDEGEHRRRVWAWIRKAWVKLEDEGLVTVISAADAGADIGGRPFSFARAANAGLRQALATEAEHFVIWGADQLPDRAVLDWGHEWFATSRPSGGPGWIRLYRGVRYLTERETEVTISGGEIARLHGQVAPMDGVVMINRSGLLATQRGSAPLGFALKQQWFDERYEGWGYEDTEFARHLTATLGAPCGPPSLRTLVELWHPAGHRDTSPANPNRKLFEAGR